jgi:hypothetical protein
LSTYVLELGCCARIAEGSIAAIIARTRAANGFIVSSPRAFREIGGNFRKGDDSDYGWKVKSARSGILAIGEMNGEARSTEEGG